MDSMFSAPPTDPDQCTFELRNAHLTGEAALKGPRQAGDKQGLDSRGGLRTLNLSLWLEGWPKQQGTIPMTGL